MKKLIFIIALFLGAAFCEQVIAQVTLKINISTQPIWGPVGYDHVEYYYLPEIDSYYYVPEHKYIYMESGHCITRTNLPQRYSHYDMYNSRKIVINDKKPYLRDKEYKTKYAVSNERYNQQSIRDSHDSRYFENKNHPEHSKWKESQKNHGNQKHDDGRKNN